MPSPRDRAFSARLPALRSKWSKLSRHCTHDDGPTARFGTSARTARQRSSRLWGLPGFPDCQRFSALTVGAGTVLWLQSLDASRWPCRSPIRGNSSRLRTQAPSFARLSLALDRAEDFSVLAVAIIPERAGDHELMAPIIVNLHFQRRPSGDGGGEEY